MVVTAPGPLAGTSTLHFIWADAKGFGDVCAPSTYAVGIWHSTTTLPLGGSWSHELIETDPYFSKKCAVNSASPPPGVLTGAYSLQPKPHAVAAGNVLYIAVPHSLDATSNRMRIEIYAKSLIIPFASWSLLHTFTTASDHQQWRPTLSAQVIGTQTAIGVGWLDTVNNSTDGGTTSAMGALSPDGGTTWNQATISQDSGGGAVSWKFVCNTREYNQQVAVPQTTTYPNGAYLMTWVDERTPPSGGNCLTGPSVRIFGAVIQPGSP